MNQNQMNQNQMNQNQIKQHEILMKYDNLTDYLLTKLPSYQLTKEQIEWIHQYFEKSPDSLQQIIEEMENILSDGVIDVKDIPRIVKCISIIYHERSVIMDMADLSNLLLLVRYTLDCMIETNMFITHYLEKKTLEFVVDSSLDLLQYNFSTPSIDNPPNQPIAPIPPIVKEQATTTCYGHCFLYFLGL